MRRADKRFRAMLIGFFCLSLLVVMALIILLGQPRFEEDATLIKIYGTYVCFHSWGLLGFIISMVVFLNSFVLSFIKRGFQIPTMALTILSGMLSMIISLNITYGWTSYPPLSAFDDGVLTAELYESTFTIIHISLMLLISVTVVRWYILTNKLVKSIVSK